MKGERERERMRTRARERERGLREEVGKCTLIVTLIVMILLFCETAMLLIHSFGQARRIMDSHNYTSSIDCRHDKNKRRVDRLLSCL